MYADGGGLYLQITTGTDEQAYRSWIFRYRPAGAKRDRYMGLGSLSTVGLSQARELALRHRRQRIEGIDPLEQRNAERAAASASQLKTVTFDECLAGYLAAHRSAWRSDKHRKQWDVPLRRLVSPVLGKLPVSEIDTPLVVKALQAVWEETPGSAARVRGRVESILDWAGVSGFRSGDNPARWRGHLEHVLPAIGNSANHHAAVPFRELPALMLKLRQIEGTVARCLEFLILTIVRSGEARESVAAEISMAEALWVIPRGRMKADAEHRVPLSPAALAVVNEQLALCSGELLFSVRDGTPVSDTSLRRLMQTLGYGQYTVHGLRSSFRDWAGEMTAFPREVCEQALAHKIGNAAELAYARGDLLLKRRRLMDAWADFCARPIPTGATVTQMREAMSK
jgi:integrase